MPLLDRAAEIFASMPDSAYGAVGTESLADVYKLAGDAASEKNARQRVLNQLSEATQNVPLALARAHCNYALCCLRMLDVDGALQHTSNALVLCDDCSTTAKYIRLVALVCRALADVHNSSGSGNAMHDMHEALEICDSIEALGEQSSNVAIVLLQARLKCILAHVMQLEHSSEGSAAEFKVALELVESVMTTDAKGGDADAEADVDVIRNRAVAETIRMAALVGIASDLLAQTTSSGTSTVSDTAAAQATAAAAAAAAAGAGGAATLQEAEEVVKKALDLKLSYPELASVVYCSAGAVQYLPFVLCVVGQHLFLFHLSASSSSATSSRRGVPATRYCYLDDQRTMRTREEERHSANSSLSLRLSLRLSLPLPPSLSPSLPFSLSPSPSPSLPLSLSPSLPPSPWSGPT